MVNEAGQNQNAIQDIIESMNNEIKQLEATTAQNDTLSKKKEFLEVELDQLATQKEQLAIQKNTLSQKIQSLTQTQLESELLIALQKNQVDSFRFENIKDALLLEKNNLILTY